MGIKSKTDLYLPEFNFQNQNGVYISDADFSSKLVNFQEGLKIVDFWKKKKHIVGFTNGCFDYLHPGHISLFKQAKKKCGIITGIIICSLRNMSPSHSLELSKLAVKYKNKGVVGFDLAGIEENFPAKKHKEAFYLILNNNINTTIHAGEAFGPKSIHQAIHICGAHRIGHGTRVYEDKDLLNYINNHRIPLEICLTSNIHTKTVSSISKHPFKYYINEKVRVTLNTDNRLISNTSLSKEYEIAINNFNLNENEIRTIIINGFKSAFLPHNKRRELIRKVADELESEFNFSKHLII